MLAVCRLLLRHRRRTRRQLRTYADAEQKQGGYETASSVPGHAMKGTDRARMLGAIVGKALEPLPSGTGIVEVLVTLQ